MAMVRKMLDSDENSDSTKVLLISPETSLATNVTRTTRLIWPSPAITILPDLTALLRCQNEGEYGPRFSFDLVFIDLSIVENAVSDAIWEIRRLPLLVKAALVAVGDRIHATENERQAYWSGADLVIQPGDMRRLATDIASLVIDRWLIIDCSRCSAYNGTECCKYTASSQSECHAPGTG